MKHYHKNPRQITGKQFEQLRVSLAELGDLSGIVHNIPTDEIIGGNQRVRVFDLATRENDIVVTQEYDAPTKAGTVALGYIEWNGERYSYRAVVWDAKTCEQANIQANKLGGTWDFDILANEFDDGDLLEWGFEAFELGIEENDESPSDFSEYDDDINTDFCCPKCGYEWSGTPK